MLLKHNNISLGKKAALASKLPMPITFYFSTKKMQNNFPVQHISVTDNSDCQKLGDGSISGMDIKLGLSRGMGNLGEQQAET